MNLEHVFRDVQTDRGSLLHGRLLWWQFDTVTLAHRCRRGRPPHHPELTYSAGTKRYVWTTPSKQGRFGMLRRGRVRSCVRPTLRGPMTAGPDAIRSLAPKPIYALEW